MHERGGPTVGIHQNAECSLNSRPGATAVAAPRKPATPLLYWRKPMQSTIIIKLL